VDRPRLLLTAIAGMLLAGLVALGALAPAAQAGPNCDVDATPDAEEEQFLALINDYRQDNGLGPLALSPALTKAAAWKSQHMADANYFAHDDVPIARSWDDRIRDCGYDYNTWIGENIAAGNSGASATFDQWRNSPGHNQNMLSGNYNAIGIGRAFGASAAYGWYWTTDFGGFVDGAPPPPNTPTNTPVTPTPTNTPVAPPATSSPQPPVPTATSPLPPPAPPDPDGDVSCGGGASSLDAALVLQLDARVIASLPCLEEGDVNGDGVVNAIDALVILQYSAGLIASLPV
jgi:uncharacterized protein YkwD